jgi:hypothetical protein
MNSQGVVVHTCILSAQEAGVRRSQIQGHPGLLKQTPSQKKKKEKQQQILKAEIGKMYF